MHLLKILLLFTIINIGLFVAYFLLQYFSKAPLLTKILKFIQNKVTMWFQFYLVLESYLFLFLLSIRQLVVQPE